MSSAIAYSLLDYHEESKHRLARYAPGPGRLDWANQPDPFRTYKGAQRVLLPLGAENLAVRYRELRAGQRSAPRAFDRDSIGLLFELSLAVSAWKSAGGTRWALRTNPSSGNLHPTEGYLVSGELPGLEAGVYHYLSRDHALERRARLPAQAPRGGVLVALTTIYWREAWKYGMRAFRYCEHDCGHAIGALAYAAAALGWRAQIIGEAGDSMIARITGVGREADRGEAAPEAPECLIWISACDAAPALDALSAALDRAEWRGRANQLSQEQIEWRQIDAVARLAQKPEETGAPAGHPLPQKALRSVPALDLLAAPLIRERRSAVALDGVTRIAADAFYAMLEATLPGERPPWEAWPFAPRVHLALFVHRVDGLEPGLYLLVRNAETLARLKSALRSDWLWRKTGPAWLPLYLLLPHDLREAAKLVSCHQDIAADSCFALGMLADFAGVPEAPWRYRERFWECGLIGQALYLEAGAGHITATGIGCFFDDEMHELLGIADSSFQSLYHFTAGGAVDDPRLSTLPAYPARRG
jgi:SagB-type dehydrogenase family enzyme